MKLVVLLLLFFSSAIFASQKQEVVLSDLSQEEEFKHGFMDDAKTTWKYARKGFRYQFSRGQNWILWTTGSLILTYYFIHDQRFSSEVAESAHDNQLRGFYKVVSDSSIIMDSPLVPLLFYYTARLNEDEKMLRFSQEYFAAGFIALMESALLSAVPIHERPSKDGLTKWETNFRQESSFPSGHTIGYTVFAFKLFQFYGPWASAIPFGLAAITAYERVYSQKHYMTDVLAAGLISLMASEGVRVASNYNNNHPLYKWMFEHQFDLKYFRSKCGNGLLVSITY
jgi:membrane-associated phospholipid phosphatase